MNSTPITLPGTWQEWVELFVRILAGGAEIVVRNPWTLTVTLVFITALAAAWSAPLGTREDSEILTENDRKVVRDAH